MHHWHFLREQNQKRERRLDNHSAQAAGSVHANGGWVTKTLVLSCLLNVRTS